MLRWGPQRLGHMCYLDDDLSAAFLQSGAFARMFLHSTAALPVDDDRQLSRSVENWNSGSWRLQGPPLDRTMQLTCDSAIDTCPTTTGAAGRASEGRISVFGRTTFCFDRHPSGAVLELQCADRECGGVRHAPLPAAVFGRCVSFIFCALSLCPCIKRLHWTNPTIGPDSEHDSTHGFSLSHSSCECAMT